MKNISALLLVVFAQNMVEAQLPKGKSCPYTCNRIPFQEYKQGMRVYFPTNKALLELDKELPDMLLKDSCAFKSNELKIANYKDLAGKTFRIDSVTFKLAKAYPGDNHYIFTIKLQGMNCNARLTYKRIVDKRKLRETGNDESEEDTYTIEGAIVVDEVEYARNNLVGNSYFLISKDEEKHNQTVTITRVDPGTYETPLLIYYEDQNKNVDSVFVGICNTNVEVPFLKPFHFTKFFSCESKPLPVIKTEMTTKEVIEALGKPKKITTTETGSLKTEEYVYEGRTLTFENGKLKKIVMTE